MGGDDKQLLFGAAAALLVLTLGLVAYLRAGSPEAPAVAPPETPTGKRLVLAGSDKTQRPERSAGADAAAPPRSRVPMLDAGTREPRVRPAHLTAGIERDLRASEAAFQACYATELKTRPDAKGRAVLQFSIDENSEVSSIGVELRAIPSIPLKQCLEGVAQEVVFGSVDEPAVVWWPLLMWPDKGLSVQSPVVR